MLFTPKKNPKTNEYLVYDGTGKLIGKEIDNLVYSLDESTVLGISENYRDDKKFIIRPGTKRIETCAFFKENYIEEVILPPSLESIDRQAFAYSSLKKINLDNVIHYGSSAFASSKLSGEITINKNAKFDLNQDDNACTFSDCLISKMNFGPSVVLPSLCDFCSNLEEVVFTGPLRRIHSFAFSNSGLKKIEFPDTLEDIGSHAFRNTNLVTVSFPAKLEHLGRGAFGKCSDLENIYFNPNGKTKLSIEERCFAASSVVSAEIPSNATVLGEKIFSDCQNLIILKINAPIDTIPIGIAENCTKLKDIFLNENIKEIDSNAFTNTGLERVDEQFKNIESFKSGCFSDCENLTFVHIPKNSRLDKNIFLECKNLDLLIAESTLIDKKTFAGMPSDTIILVSNSDSIPESIKLSYHIIDIKDASQELIDKILKYMSFREFSKIFSFPDKDVSIIK